MMATIYCRAIRRTHCPGPARTRGMVRRPLSARRTSEEGLMRHLLDADGSMQSVVQIAERLLRGESEA